MTEHITEKQSNYSCDFLIIGGGSAGLLAHRSFCIAGFLKCLYKIFIFN